MIKGAKVKNLLFRKFKDTLLCLEVILSQV